MKKALQGLKNQLAIDTDHWKKIIGELIVVKHGRQPVPGDELLCGGSGGSLTVDGAKTLADFLGERKTVSSRSKPTSHSLAVELPLHIGDREQVEGMRRLPPGTRLEHLLE